MKKISWNLQKAKILNEDRTRGGVSFEDCVVALEEGRVLDDLPHPSEGYEHQRLLILEINNYAYVVPYVETETELFFKTVFPSRKHTSIYLAGKNHD